MGFGGAEGGPWTLEGLMWVCPQGPFLMHRLPGQALNTACVAWGHLCGTDGQVPVCGL